MYCGCSVCEHEYLAEDEDLLDYTESTHIFVTKCRNCGEERIRQEEHSFERIGNDMRCKLCNITLNIKK